MTRLRKISHRLALISILALTACASASTVQRQSLDAGIARRFQAPYEQTKEAVLSSLTQLKFTPVAREELPDGHTILIGRPPHGFSWGEVGRIFIEKSDDKPTIVRVVYEKRITMQMASSNFPRYLFAKMDEVLAAQGVTAPSAPLTADEGPPPTP